MQRRVRRRVGRRSVGGRPLGGLVLAAVVRAGVALTAGGVLAGGVLAGGVAAAASPEPGWTWPLGDGPADVGRAFDPPETAYGAGHRGVDLVGEADAVVRAAGAGRVSYAGLLAGRGVVVVVHGDLRTTYEPVLSDVAVGQPVSAGQPLGRLAAGHPGCPAPACLHWGLRRGETYLDPLALLRAGPVRLLPLGERVQDPTTSDVARRAAAGVPSQPGPPGVPVPLATPRDGSRAEPGLPSPEPGGLSLRAAVTPSGGLALLAFALGLALLRARPPRRPGPTGPATAMAASSAEPSAPVGAAAPVELVDLGAERAVRRGPA